MCVCCLKSNLLTNFCQKWRKSFSDEKKIALISSSPSLVFFAFTACEKVIDIKLDEADSQYVIVSKIENDNKPCSVSITKTVGFSAANEYPAVKGAVVTLSDSEGNKETLTETKAGIYEGKSIKGKAGVTYTLEVKHDGKTFIAKSKMSSPTALNDLRFIQNSLALPGDTAKTYNVVPFYQDKANTKNFYRYILNINQKEVQAILVANDLVNDGKVNTRPLFSREQVNRGDTIKVQLLDIDEYIYNYFYSLAQSSGDGPGGGSTPSNPVTNWSNNALGYFSAQAKSEKTAIVK